MSFSTLVRLSLYYAAIGFYFVNQLWALCIAFDKCFYVCGELVVKFLCIKFQTNEEQFTSKSMH